MSDGTPAGPAAQAPVSPPVGPATTQEDAMRADARRFKIVAIVAGALFAPQVIAHLLIPLLVIPTLGSMFASMGGALPAPTAILMAMGPWSGVLMVVIDVLAFWGFYLLARRYWIGLLFAPIFAVGVVTSLFTVALYLPMFEVITLVK
jgi:type II secretory pathway component PulF